MENRRELIRNYKETPIKGGVYQIKNTVNGKICIIATPNLKTITGRKFELSMGGYKNEALQKDWNAFGENAFVFEILEELKKPEGDVPFDPKDALKKLEAKWLDKLQPYGEKGYNRKKEARK